MKIKHSFFKATTVPLLLGTLFISSSLLTKAALADDTTTTATISEATEPIVTTETERTSPSVNEENPTIKAALEDAKKSPECWLPIFEEENFTEATTILVMPEGAFISGQIELGTGESWDSDTDPNATTLGELLTALDEHDLNPYGEKGTSPFKNSIHS